MNNLKCQKDCDCAKHAQVYVQGTCTCGECTSHSKRYYQASLKTTLRKTISLPNKLRGSNLIAVN